MTGQPSRTLLISLLGIAAFVVVAVLVWQIATRKGVVDQLVETICADDVPDAVWAFETLKQVSGREVLDLVRYVDDMRSARVSSRSEYFPLADVCRIALQDHLDARQDLLLHSGMMTRNTEEIRAIVEEWLRSRHASHAPSRSLSCDVTPPSRNPTLQRIAAGRDVGALLDLLTGEDGPVAHWAYEVIKELPDDDLDLVVPRLRTPATTPVHVYALLDKWPRAATEASKEPIDLTALLCVVLAERAGGGSLRATLAANLPHRPTPETLAAVKSAWKDRRAPYWWMQAHR